MGVGVLSAGVRGRHYANVNITGKHPAPRWLSIDAAATPCTEGIGIRQWTSNDQDAEPDVVMACEGDVPALETLAAVSMPYERLPKLRIRVPSVVDPRSCNPSRSIRMV